MDLAAELALAVLVRWFALSSSAQVVKGSWKDTRVSPLGGSEQLNRASFSAITSGPS